MHHHGSSPQSQSASGTLNSHTCSHCESASRLEELCPAGIAEYDAWLQDNTAEVREETIRLSPAQLFAALELFDAETQPQYVLTVRVERAA